jgi:hypothetical protein
VAGLRRARLRRDISSSLAARHGARRRTSHRCASASHRPTRSAMLVPSRAALGRDGDLRCRRLRVGRVGDHRRGPDREDGQPSDCCLEAPKRPSTINRPDHRVPLAARRINSPNIRQFDNMRRNRGPRKMRRPGTGEGKGDAGDCGGAIRRALLDLDIDWILEPSRIEVAMIGRRRATRQQELRQREARRNLKRRTSGWPGAHGDVNDLVRFFSAGAAGRLGRHATHCRDEVARESGRIRVSRQIAF